MFIAKATGYILDATGSYVPVFAVAGCAYLVALLCVHLLSPTLAAVRIKA
jgi:ACS family hexuronate transporter-like MFS transporter